MNKQLIRTTMSKQINVKARRYNQQQDIGQQMMAVQYKIHIRKVTRRYLETMVFDDFMHTITQFRLYIIIHINKYNNI